MSALFSPYRVGSLELRNRIVIAPMCQYSADEGRVTDWHVIHLGNLAPSGAALLIIEATAPTATSCTSSSRPSATSVTTHTAVASTTGCDSRWRCSTRCAPRSRPGGPSACESQAPTGPRAAGTSSRPSPSRGTPGARLQRGPRVERGHDAGAAHPGGPGDQVPLARAVRAATGLPTIAVGLITDFDQAEMIVGTGDADLVAVARTITYDPRWPWHAAHLGVTVKAPKQYLRCQPGRYRNPFES